MQKQTVESGLFNLFLIRERKARMGEGKQKGGGEKEKGKLLYILTTCYEAIYIWGKCYHHFTDEETETLRDEMVWLIQLVSNVSQQPDYYYFIIIIVVH